MTKTNGYFFTNNNPFRLYILWYTMWNLKIHLWHIHWPFFFIALCSPKVSYLKASNKGKFEEWNLSHYPRWRYIKHFFTSGIWCLLINVPGTPTVIPLVSWYLVRCFCPVFRGFIQIQSNEKILFNSFRINCVKIRKSIFFGYFESLGIWPQILRKFLQQLSLTFSQTTCQDIYPVPLFFLLKGFSDDQYNKPNKVFLKHEKTEVIVLQSCHHRFHRTSHPLCETG